MNEVIFSWLAWYNSSLSFYMECQQGNKLTNIGCYSKVHNDLKKPICTSSCLKIGHLKTDRK
jgi:hypothetical protein